MMGTPRCTRPGIRFMAKVWQPTRISLFSGDRFDSYAGGSARRTHATFTRKDINRVAFRRHGKRAFGWKIRAVSPLIARITRRRPIESHCAHPRGYPLQDHALASLNFTRRHGERNNLCLIGIREWNGDRDCLKEDTPAQRAPVR